MHSERPKLYTNLALITAIGLRVIKLSQYLNIVAHVIYFQDFKDFLPFRFGDFEIDFPFWFGLFFLSCFSTLLISSSVPLAVPLAELFLSETESTSTMILKAWAQLFKASLA